MLLCATTVVKNQQKYNKKVLNDRNERSKISNGITNIMFIVTSYKIASPLFINMSFGGWLSDLIFWGFNISVRLHEIKADKERGREKKLKRGRKSE